MEKAARDAGHDIAVPFTPGRTDATEEQTDAESFDVLEPMADGFRNYEKTQYSVSAEETAGGQGPAPPPLRAGDDGARGRHARNGRQQNLAAARTACSPIGPGQLTNDFFVQPASTWAWSGSRSRAKTSSRRATARPARPKWTGTRVDLVFGSNSQLRALAEVYASDGNEPKFVADFVKAWVKVMENDRFDLR